MSNGCPIDVFSYMDYRSFLRAYYDAKKAEGRGFSFRYFSRRIGVRTPNHLKRVMDGDRNLTPEMAQRYARVIGLDGETAAYFCDLVEFGQARGTRARNLVYEKLRAARGYRRAQELDLAHAQYHSRWYVPVIREMAASADFQADPHWIADRLLPRISPSQAASALKLLFDLDLLVTDEDGRVRQADSVLTTGPETRGLHIANYHRAMLERASESIDLVDATSRDISAVTLTVRPDDLPALKERIRAFRRAIIAEFEHTGPGCRVVQLNLQLFPLTERLEVPE